MQISIRQATPEKAAVVAHVLGEAARWLEGRGMPLWKGDELTPARLDGDVAAGLFFLAECSGEPASVVKFQLEDPDHWPDVPADDSAFLHRLAVRRRFAGQGVSTALLRWAVDRTASLSRRYLRFDCVADRMRLREIYEQFGFRYHSDYQVGPYLVARYEFEVSRKIG